MSHRAIGTTCWPACIALELARGELVADHNGVWQKPSVNVVAVSVKEATDYVAVPALSGSGVGRDRVAMAVIRAKKGHALPPMPADTGEDEMRRALGVAS